MKWVCCGANRPQSSRITDLWPTADLRTWENDFSGDQNSFGSTAPSLMPWSSRVSLSGLPRELTIAQMLGPERRPRGLRTPPPRTLEGAVRRTGCMVPGTPPCRPQVPCRFRRRSGVRRTGPQPVSGQGSRTYQHLAWCIYPMAYVRQGGMCRHQRDVL